ncbi:polyprenol phosphomannose-dependent alpha 1,6 mannosyltransferase MptB [Candidatus Frankia nodulisporulans]|uniref:polyprenol phosphomannose-dependent alpha 1,6 mannosyltransferase MptB n=1 Tax=Candidatus Frankia nodulisporulans TaxID=2060052 RepID=UPI0013D66189|nr:polyprenol phosphomannose-dependent alpha 1,6 mannosyltransferase MptB [Candidatus Frankia nodulisporulans]
MITEGRLGPRDLNVTDPTSWWGILPSAPPGETTRGVLAGLSALGIITLCGCWAALGYAALAGRVPTRTGLAAAFAWTLPFALGPPLFSRDVYAYAGQGELARLGLDPARHGIAALATSGAVDGSGPVFVRAVDPRWTLTHSPYGGAAVAVEKVAAVVGGGPAGTVVALRVFAVVAVLALIAGALRLAGRDPRRRAVVAVLVAANPVLAVHLVGGAHLDAAAAALVVAALLLQGRTRNAARTDGGGRWAAVLVGAGATGLAALAGNVKVTVLPVVVWLVVAHLLDARRGPRPVPDAMIRLAADVVAIAVATALCAVAAGFGPTWVHALATSGALSTGIAPASLLAHAVHALLGLVGIHTAAETTLTASRDLCLALAAAFLVGLVLRAWRRTPTPTSDDAAPGVVRPDLAVVGYGGLAVALANPVVYPWYLAACLPALAILAVPRTEPPARTRTFAAAGPLGAAAVGAIVASVWLCLATLSPLAATWRLLGPVGLALLVTVVASAALGGGRAAMVAARRRPAAPTSTR